VVEPPPGVRGWLCQPSRGGSTTSNINRPPPTNFRGGGQAVSGVFGHPRLIKGWCGHPQTAVRSGRPPPVEWQSCHYEWFENYPIFLINFFSFIVIIKKKIIFIYNFINYIQFTFSNIFFKFCFRFFKLFKHNFKI